MENTDKPTVRPNPGSHEALKQGCRCPVLDNNHGKVAPWPGIDWAGGPAGWWIIEGCPIHAPKPQEAIMARKDA